MYKETEGANAFWPEALSQRNDAERRVKEAQPSQLAGFLERAPLKKYS